MLDVGVVISARPVSLAPRDALKGDHKSSSSPRRKGWLAGDWEAHKEGQGYWEWGQEGGVGLRLACMHAPTQNPPQTFLFVMQSLTRSPHNLPLTL